MEPGNQSRDSARNPSILRAHFHDVENSTNRGTADTLHWTLFNIPGTAKGIPEGLGPGELPDGTKNGPGLRQRGGNPGAYFGPGAGPGPFHHYIFEFYALDIKLDLPANTTREELLKAMEGHVIGKAAYTGPLSWTILNSGQDYEHLALSFGSADFGLLYVGFADCGSGGDPFNLAQNLTSAFGKILRIDPFGKNSANGKYGIPPSTRLSKTARMARSERSMPTAIRNPQRFCWDSKTGAMFVADIGQNIVEEISPVTAGANLGWNKWEGSCNRSSMKQVTASSEKKADYSSGAVERQ